MQQQDKNLIQRVGKSLMWIVLLMITCKFTSGLAVGILFAYGLMSAFSQKTGRSLTCYVLFPLFVVMNPYLTSISGTGQAILKIGFMVMTLLLMITAVRRSGHERVPLGMLWLYLGVSIISSINGYHPLISFLKLLNFGFFIAGIWMGLRNLDKAPKDLLFLRSFLLAIAVLIVIGSLATIPFPGIAYFVSVNDLIREYGVDVINRQGIGEGRMGLLCGVTNQSQCLAPLSVLATAWTLCDMLFVERRISVVHLAIVGCSLPLMFMTRSRCALLSFFVAMVTINTYGFSNIPVSMKVKSGMRSAMIWFGLLMIVGAIIMEIKDHSITRWIRKTDDIAADSKSLNESFTASRQGVIAESMYDFHRNPMFGCGFQVDQRISYLYPKDKIAFSAPIEKGVLPTMILGESGVVGGVVFIAFLISFFGTCLTRHYTVTAILMTVLLTTNLAEATFFSTGGAGGILWIMALVGGFTIDMLVKVQNRSQRLNTSFYR